MVSALAYGALMLTSAAVFVAGIALFTIARQDDSKLGQAMGLLAIVSGMALMLYSFGGKHWL